MADEQTPEPLNIPAADEAGEWLRITCCDCHDDTAEPSEFVCECVCHRM